jgi:carboxypeptidase family protein/TonB-dependent receptor-like protein
MRARLLGVFVLSTALSCFGQTFGEITGVVTDSAGGVVAAAAVTVTNPATNLTRTAATNNAGNYTFPSLLPGVYSVKVEMQGFQTENRAGIELQVQQVARIDFQLKVGSLTETVEVTGGAPLLATENATVGTVIENRRIVDLPLNGRNFISLIALSPNVNANFANSYGGAGSRQGGDRTQQQFSVAGMRREFNYFTLDGVANSDVNFNTYLFLPSIDALQEFKVQTGVYSAEFGHEAAQVNVSTKGGTNEYHGALFEFLRNSKLDARPYAFTSQVPDKNPFKWNQYGFTLGGPVRIPKLFNGKDRLFFMSNFEGFRLRNQTQTVASTAPAAMRTGDFSQILRTTPIKDPLNNNQPFSGNMITPITRLDSIARGLLEFFPEPNVPGAGLVNNYLALDRNVTDKDQFTQRIDFVESAKSNWFGRYSWQDERVVQPLLKLNGTNLLVNVKQAMISNIRILSPNVVNEFRFGYNGFFNSNGRELAYQRDVTKELGLPILSDPPPAAWGIPFINISGYSTFGDQTDGPYVTNDHTFQWIDNISWTHGTHSMKFGGEIRRDRFNQAGNQFIRGSFIIQGQSTGYAFADYMLGYTRQDENSAGLAVTQFRATSQAYYVDDSWKVRPNLTVNVGLRYEFTPAWADRGDSLVNADVPYIDTGANVPLSRHPTLIRIGSGAFYANSPVLFDPSVIVARDGRLGDRLIASDYKNFAPRLGIAWSPSAKWTVRAGAGMFYVQDQGNPRFDMGRTIAGRKRDIATNNELTFEHPFLSSGTNPCNVPSPPFICISTPQIFANMYRRRTPYVELYELNLQRQLSGNTVVEIGYMGTQGHQLERLYYLNQPVPGTTPVLARAPYPELGIIQEVGNVIDANYNSLTAKLTRRLSGGLTLLAGYTYSKSIDDGSGLRVIGTDGVHPQDSRCLSCERSVSIFDARQRFVTSVLYDLPFGKGRKFLNRGIASGIIGGWQVNSIVTASTGFPENISSGVDRSSTAVGNDRPNATGISPKLDNPTTNAWFNIQAFAVQPLGTFGNVGRDVLTGPGIFSWDFSTLKNFYFTERRYLQFRFEAFNAANHPVWGDPGVSVNANRLTSAGVPIAGTGAFGVISSTRNGVDMRELQFSLKLIF